MQGIVWLSSYPKSGNTWMRAYLANLLSDKPGPLPLAEVQKVCTGEALKTWYKTFFGEDFPTDDNERVAQMRGEVQRRIASLFNNPVFLKTHCYLGEAHGHPIFNMDATIAAIYIVRNPLDVAISAAPHYGVTIDKSIEYLADEHHSSKADGELVYEKTADWSLHVKSWTQVEHPGLLVLRYEDMLSKPEKAFTRVARFLGIRKTKKQIRQAIKNASFKTLQDLEKKEGFSEKPAYTEQFFRKGKAGDWKNTLTDEQIRQVINSHREQMERFGYIPEGYEDT